MNITIDTVTHRDSPEIYKLVDKNRPYLTNLSWSQDATEWSVNAYICNTIRSDDELYTIRVDGAIVGLITFRDCGEFYNVGYWLDNDHRGKGVMTAALGELLRGNAETYRAEIRSKNVASRRVLEKNGFVVVNSFLNGEWILMEKTGV